MSIVRWAGRTAAAVATVAGLLVAQQGTASAGEYQDYVDGAWLYLSTSNGGAQGSSGAVYNAIWLDRTLAPGQSWDGPLGKRYNNSYSDFVWSPGWYFRTCVDRGSNGIRCGSWH